MKKDWRSTKWNDFDKQQKLWFIILAVTFVVFMIAAGFASANDISIPDWVGIVVVAILVFEIHKFTGLVPWSLSGTDSNADDDESDDEEPDDEEPDDEEPDDED